MFDTVRKKVSILQVVADDMEMEIVECGTNVYRLEDDEQVGCPFCSHKGCFKLFFSEDEAPTNGFHCFSCEAHGNVVDWRMKRKAIDARTAALELAKEYEIDLPNTFSPVQEIFTLAAKYYETCLWDTCNRPYNELNKLTPLNYQKEIRKHSEEAIRSFQVGWSDGGLIAYLEAFGFDQELLDQSGLRNKKTGRDFLPSRCFIYPHYVKGKVSHFTFKDVSKKLAYQLPSKHSMNGYEFYGQDVIKESEVIYIVEGENDRISLTVATNGPVIATIGQISASQLTWLRENCANKHLVTVFDPDEAGDKYRGKMEKIRRAFKDLTQIKPPEDKDIDKYIAEGGDLKLLLENHVVVPTVEAGPVQLIPTPSSMRPTPTDPGPKEILGTDLASRMDESEGPMAVQEVAKVEVQTEADQGKLEAGQILLDGGVYWKVSFKENAAQFKKISDFRVELKNIFITEDGDRHREVVIIRDDGYKSQPVLINSETKVSLKPFRTLLARAADADFRGREEDLIGMWDLVYSQSAETQVTVTRTVGRQEKTKGWIFQNTYISDSGAVIPPDQDGVFWINGKTIGIRPESLISSSNSAMTGKEGRNDIPYIQSEVSFNESEELLKGMVHNLAKNLNDPGKALMLLGWIYSCVHSNTIFSLNSCFPFLFFWGTKGKGKTAIAKWLLDIFDMRNSGFTSVSQLKSAVGWGRKVEYYSSLPVAIDEIRSDRETEEYLGIFRSYYDRTPRTMGTREDFGVKVKDVRSCFMFIGEDQFDDPAARERCIPIRIPANGRELTESYRWMEDNKHLFSGVAFNWILESTRMNKDDLKDEIRALDKELVSKAGCSQRTSKNWAAVGVFAQRLCDKFMPEFDFKTFLFETSTSEAKYQKTDTTVTQFFELAEAITAQEFPKIGANHILKEGDFIHIWFPAVFNTVVDLNRGRVTFSKNAVLQAIREEPYFVDEGRKVPMGMGAQRRAVITLDATKCPDSIKNMVPVFA